MRWAEGFIAVDWGTTNRRAYRIDQRGECVASFNDHGGVLSVAPGGFPAAVAAIRGRLGDAPLLMAGMVGSTRGWVEAPYVACPAGPEELAAKLCWVEADRIAIIPGLSVRSDAHCDVMRGEEVQLFGALAAGLVPPTCIVCHPGTHNKWVIVKDGRIVTFQTVMTGEMFTLLRAHGILSEMLGDEVTPSGAFADGVRRGLRNLALTAELFSVRSRVLLGALPRKAASSFTSGLLIGADMSVGLALAEGADILIMGRPDLTSLYAQAAAIADRPVREIDGSAAFLAGAVAIARTIP